jgi:flagellin
MTRINTNVDSLTALNNLGRTNKQLGVSLTRLSTGVRVNSGKDDPAGLIGGEFLRQEISSIESALSNNNRANNVLSSADAALGEISNLLDDVRGILTTSANTGVLSEEEIEANQSVIDSAVSSINRIATTTQFAGRKLLDGSLGFQTSGVTAFSDSSGGNLTGMTVRQANFNANGDAITVDVTLTTAATQASITLGSATATSDSVIEVTGDLGSATVTIANGENVDAAINSVSDATGVQSSGTAVTSTGYGESSFVTLRNISGTVLSNQEETAEGTNAIGTINGNAFSGSGLKGTLKTSQLDLDVTFSAGAAGGTNFSFQITGGGARFQLGQNVNSGSQINVGIQSFQSGSLGNAVVGTLSSIVTGGTNSLLEDKAAQAVQIVETALSQVTTARAQLGSLQSSTIETNINSLEVSLENLSAARSQIVDTDFAAETANLTRLQILVQAGTSSLAIANSRPQGVLSLLG